MSKTRLVFSIQSYNDIITNSSSEIIEFSSRMSKGELEDLIHDLIRMDCGCSGDGGDVELSRAEDEHKERFQREFPEMTQEDLDACYKIYCEIHNIGKDGKDVYWLDLDNGYKQTIAFIKYAFNATEE